MMETLKTSKTQANAYGKATNFRVFSSCKSSVHIKTFWVTTITFWICFFVWFGNLYLISWIQRDINLSSRSINISKTVLTISTIISRLIIGDLCDKIGARYCYLLIMIITIFPVCLLSFITNSIQYIICNMLIGIVGSSFVITQYHTSQFFTDRLVGIANATSAGWGNFGGGCAAFIMPLIANNTDNVTNWRYLTFALGLFLIVPILLYYYVAQDTMSGNLEYKKVVTKKNLFNMSGFKTAIKDYRTWILFLVYMQCFGVEITIIQFMNNYLQYEFDLNVGTAGLIVFIFSSLNLFARSAGGYGSDVLYRKYGIQGRVYTLFLVLLSQSVFLCIFSFGSFS